MGYTPGRRKISPVLYLFKTCFDGTFCSDVDGTGPSCPGWGLVSAPSWFFPLCHCLRLKEGSSEQWPFPPIAQWGHRMSQDVGHYSLTPSTPSSLSAPQSEFTDAVKGEILPFPLWNTEVLCDDKWMDLFSAEVSNSHPVARGRKKNTQHFGSNKQPFAFKNASRSPLTPLKNSFCVCFM